MSRIFMADRYSQYERCRLAALMEVHMSTRLVRDIFQNQFRKSPPSHLTIRRVHEKFINTGSIQHSRGAGRHRTSTSEAEKIRVQEFLMTNPRESIRKAALALETTTYAVKRCAKELQLRTFRISLVHGLLPGDSERRVSACQILAEMAQVDASLMSKLLFTDEAAFHLSCYVNTSTARIWGYENPRIARSFYRDSPKINVWCGLTSEIIIGPFFFTESTVTGGSYTDMLRLFVLPQLQERDLTDNGYFMQDGAPPHWAIEVRSLLDDVFPGRWIGRGGPLAWPARSPDLTPCDFFLWGYIKEIVYKDGAVNDIQTLRNRITEAFEQVTADMLQKVGHTTLNRWHQCIENGGGHVECRSVLP